MNETEKPKGTPVYACERSDYENGMKPDGYAWTPAEAAKIMRRVIAERDGDCETGIKASNVYYSRALQAWFVDE